MNKEKIRKGNLRISRVTIGGSLEPDYIRIEIEDELSNTQFLEADLSLEDLAKTITSGGSVPISYKLRGIKNIGKKFENMSDIVSVSVKDEMNGPTPEEIGDALVPYMMDGWICRESDFENYHKWVRSDEVGVKKFNINFFRWVDVEEKGKEC